MVQGTRRRQTLGALFTVVLGLALACVPAGAQRVRAATLLHRFTDASFDASPFLREETVEFEAPRGRVRARIYGAAAVVEGAPAVVLVHGVHDKGIDEPRLARFARAIAASGVTVMTPQIDELADYRIEASSIDTVEAAALALAERTHRERVGVMGMSFGGGLALLAASRPNLADRVSFVVAVGAHDNLERVTTFFVTRAIVGPDGTRANVQPHDYGAMVLAYAHARDLFPQGEVAIAEAAMNAWLREKQDDARTKAATLSPPSRARVEALFAGRFGEVRQELLRIITTRKPEMAAVSPSAHVAGIRAPVYLLHGAGDTVIPATETAWLARDVPKAWLRESLVSRALVHVDMDSATPLYEQWQIVDFMARVLNETDGS